MMSDLVDGVNKFGTDWKRIKKEYKFIATVNALTMKWRYSKKHQHITLEDGKWKVLPGNYICIFAGTHNEKTHLLLGGGKSPTHLMKTAVVLTSNCFVVCDIG